MKFYLSVLIGLFTLVINADVNKLKNLNSISNVVTEVKYSDGIEVSADCTVRFLMGGFKQVGPYILDGTRLINDDYVKTVVNSGASGSVTNIHIYGQRRVTIDLLIDNKLKTYSEMWIHQPITNDIYATGYDWHLSTSLTNCVSNYVMNISVNYANEYGYSLLKGPDPLSEDMCGSNYLSSFVEINKNRIVICSAEMK